MPEGIVHATSVTPERTLSTMSLDMEEWRRALSADDVGAAGEWLAACRASGEGVDLSQLLHTAAWRGAAKIVKLLLDSGAKVDAKDEDGMTALMWTAEDWSSGHYACVECLLEHGANPNARDRTGSTVLLHALLEAEHAKMPEALSLLERTVATLLQHGADASAPGASDAVFAAARLETTALLELLLDAGASASGSRQARSEAELQELACSLGMDVDELGGAIDQEVQRPLQTAIHAKNVAAVRLLLERGANANDLLTEGRTPLLYAVEVNAVDLIPELVKHGADINAPERKFGRTPLMWACREGASPQVVQALLDHGARIDLRQHIGHDAIIEGETALSMAYLSQRRELIDILLTRGARERGFLGVVLYPSAVSADVRARLKLDAGAIVANVLRNSAADVAGIQRDDAIIELAGRPVAGDDDFTRILSSRLAGDKLRCLILRQGKHIEVPVELHPSCRAQRKYPEPERGFLGVVWYPPAVSADVQARLKLEAGAIIAKVEQDSAADIAGIQRDDAIIELAGEPVARNSDVVRILSSKSTGDRFSCVVVRQGERIEVPVELKQRQRRPHQIVLHIEWPLL